MSNLAFYSYRFWHLFRYSVLSFFSFEYKVMILSNDSFDYSWTFWQVSFICWLISFCRFLTKPSNGLNVFFRFTIDFLSFWLIAREHFTRDYLKHSKFLEMLLAIVELGDILDVWLRLVIWSIRNFWNYDKWERVELILSVLVMFSNSFWSIAL